MRALRSGILGLSTARRQGAARTDKLRLLRWYAPSSFSIVLFESTLGEPLAAYLSTSALGGITRRIHIDRWRRESKGLV